DLAGHGGDDPAGRRPAPRPARLGAAESQGGGRQAGLRGGRRDHGPRALDERRHPGGDDPPGRPLPGTRCEHPRPVQRRERPDPLRRRRRRARARAVVPSGRRGGGGGGSAGLRMERPIMRSHSSWRRRTGAFVLGLAGAFILSAQPHLVADLNQERTNSSSRAYPAGGVEHDGVLYFPAHDPQHGDELWRTDGSPDGTYRLVDLCPGICSGAGRPLGFFHGSLYFLGTDPDHGTEIWRTDGTAGGEELLADACPGDCWSLANGWVEWRGALWFLSQSAYAAAQILWTSDGTREGTRPVASLCADLGICNDPSQGPPYVVLGGPDPTGQSLLVWTYGNGPQALFRTDGTAGGTVLLHSFADGFQFIDQIPRTAAPGVPLYFVDSRDLWTSDGTPAGTRLVRNLVGLVQDLFLQSTEVVDGIYYATFFDNTWLRSDGTAEGTFVLAQVGPGSDLTLARIGSSVVLLTNNGIWRTGGTPETTFQFAGPTGEIQGVVERADRLVVASFDSNQGPPFLW